MLGKALLEHLKNPLVLFGAATFVACSGEKIYIQFDTHLPGAPMVIDGMDLPGKFKACAAGLQAQLHGDYPKLPISLLGDMLFDAGS